MTKLNENSDIENLYEYGLPDYLQNDLNNLKRCLNEKDSLKLDMYLDELYGSINLAEINDGKISPAHADYLRGKYL
jgi:hypothetical protein